MIPDDYPYASPPGAQAWEPARRVGPSDPRPIVGLSPHPLLDEQELTVPPLTMIVAVVIALASVANATMLPAADAIRPGTPGFIFGFTYVCLMAGSIVGQAAILTVLVVWGSGPIWLRLAWHWGLALLAYSAWGLGWMLAFWDWIGNGNVRTDELQAALLGLPLVALCLQAVPWLFRIYFHWRIERPADSPSLEASQPLSIRDLLVWTGVVAVTCSLVRLGKPGDVTELLYWTVWGNVSAVAVGVSALAMLPMVYLTLGVNRTPWGALGVAAIAASAAAIASTLLIFINPGGPTDREIILMIGSVALGFTLTLTGPLWMVRAYGYRLVMERLAIEQPLMSPFGPARSEPRMP